MPYRQDRAIPTTDLAGRLLDAVSGIRGEADGLKDALTGPSLPLDEQALGKLLSRLLAVQALLHAARKEINGPGR
jgi:hypothetical protein